MKPQPKPHNDFAPKPGPEHEFPPYSAVCMRCGQTLLYVEETAAECVSDEAITLARVFARRRRRGFC